MGLFLAKCFNAVLLRHPYGFANLLPSFLYNIGVYWLIRITRKKLCEIMDSWPLKRLCQYINTRLVPGGIRKVPIQHWADINWSFKAIEKLVCGSLGLRFLWMMHILRPKSLRKLICFFKKSCSELSSKLQIHLVFSWKIANSVWIYIRIDAWWRLVYWKLVEVSCDIGKLSALRTWPKSLRQPWHTTLFDTNRARVSSLLEVNVPEQENT